MQKTATELRDYPEENHILGHLNIWAQNLLSSQSCTKKWWYIIHAYTLWRSFYLLYTKKTNISIVR